jgi:glycosyltransferase involved in cell wall biosynthesis
MHARPALSVIVRTLGTARVRDALASLVAQSLRDFETVLVDMSPGGLGPLVAEFTSRLSGVRHLRPGRRLSRPAALNAGLAAAAGDGIALLDEDNLYDPGHLETLAHALSRQRAGLVYTGVRVRTFTPDGTLVAESARHEPFSFSRLLFENYIYTAGTAFARELAVRLGRYDERFAVYEDWDFLIRAAAAGGVERLDALTAESRQFTGLPGLPQHALEGARARRCRAGIYWKHRRLHTSERRSDYVEVLASRHPRRFAERWMRWRYWADVLPDLPGWWWGAFRDKS